MRSISNCVYLSVACPANPTPLSTADACHVVTAGRLLHPFSTFTQLRVGIEPLVRTNFGKLLLNKRFFVLRASVS